MRVVHAEGRKNLCLILRGNQMVGMENLHLGMLHNDQYSALWILKAQLLSLPSLQLIYPCD